nr:TPA_asm: coat protein [Pseudolycopodiella ophiovirus]
MAKRLRSGEGSDSDTPLLSAFKLINADKRVVSSRLSKLEQMFKAHGDVPIQLNDNDDFEIVSMTPPEITEKESNPSITVEKMSTGQSQKMKELQGAIAKVSEKEDKASSSGGGDPKKKVTKALPKTGWVNSVNINAVMQESKFKFDADKVVKVMNDYITSIPESETYKAGEVKVTILEDSPVSVHNLIAAGTLVLDAIIYMAMHQEEEAKYLFEITTIQELEFNSVMSNLQTAKCAFISTIILIFTRGSMPAKVGMASKRPLIKLICEDLEYGMDATEQSVALDLTCSNPMKFPSSVFLKINIKDLPSKFFSRIRLSPAGNKVIKYAELASRFDKAVAPISDPPKMEDLIEKGNLEHALKLVKGLKDRQGNFEAQMMLHPLNPNKKVPVGFALKMTKAILHTLSESGRVAMRKHIDSKKILAFQKDLNFYGSTDQAGEVTWEILSDQNVNFMDVSLEMLDSIFKVV